MFVFNSNQSGYVLNQQVWWNCYFNCSNQ